MHVIRAEGSAIRAVEVVVAVAVEGATQALCIAVVYTGRPDRQTHSPVTNIGPYKGPRGKDQLKEESHIQ